MSTITCQQHVFKNIEAIIFDKDGTLADSEGFLRQLAMKRASLVNDRIAGLYEPLLKAYGVTPRYIDPKGLMAVGSNRENQLVTAGFIAPTGKSWFDCLDIASQCFTDAEKSLPTRGDTSPLFAGSLDVLKNIFNAGVKIGILSADTTQGVKDFVHNHQLTPYIDLMMGVDGGISKPDPRLYLNACASLGVAPRNTIMVGDSQGDISMAKKAGASGVIGIYWHSQEAEHLQMADVVISDLAQLVI